MRGEKMSGQEMNGNGKTPLVTVIVPVYNVEQYLETAVHSVISQTFGDWEMLLMDDCGTDGSYVIARKLAEQDKRIRLIRNEENVGVAKTRDYGISLSRGSYVAFLDSDDLWHPRKLEQQLQKLQETGADLCYTSYAIIDSEGNKARGDYLVDDTVTYDQLLRENQIGCSTVLVKKEIVEKYNFSMGYYHEDYILWLRMLRDGVVAVGCREVLVNWRYISNSRSFNKIQSAQNRWRIYRDFLNIPLPKRLWYFVNYMFGGVWKYAAFRK